MQGIYTQRSTRIIGHPSVKLERPNTSDIIGKEVGVYNMSGKLQDFRTNWLDHLRCIPKKN
jgi:hypothetical protein